MNPNPLTLSHLGIFLVSMAGFFALALATERHSEQLLGRIAAPSWRMLSRLAGWVLLAVSLAWGIAVLGTGIGITLWLGWLTLASLAWIFIFPKWPWQPPVREKPARKAKEEPAIVVPSPHLRRRIAALLLIATAALFIYQLRQTDPRLLSREDTVQGTVGPWTFVLGEAERDTPEIMEMDIPIKEYRLRFCEQCDADILQAYIKVNKPRSTRAIGMAFMGQRWERRAEIPLPSTTNADSELWLTVVGKDGTVHQTSMPLAKVSPATVAWFEKMRGRDAK